MEDEDLLHVTRYNFVSDPEVDMNSYLYCLDQWTQSEMALVRSSSRSDILKVR
jgi:hypothetical protein